MGVGSLPPAPPPPPRSWLSLGVTERPCVHWLSLICFQDGGQEDSFLEMGFLPLLLTLTVFLCDKICITGRLPSSPFF